MKQYKVDEHILLRFAEKKDTALILEFIRGLAEYENLLDTVKITEADIEKYVFEKNLIEVVIGEYDGVPAGFILFFHNFSTFLGKPGIFIEDIFVKPEFRGKGLGKIFFNFLSKIAVERDCGRIEWTCLDWNKSSIEFYKSQGAKSLNEWVVCRLSFDEIKKLADKYNNMYLS